MASIICPSCWNAQVPAVSWDFKDTKVTVPCCVSCQERGVVSYELRVTEMNKLEWESDFMVRHPEGFVAFQAAW